MTKFVADPDLPCAHEDFIATVEVARCTEDEGGPVEGFMAEVRVNCVQCGEAFRFTGVEPGLSHQRPACSIDETELRAPIRPASADRDFGMGLPGFAVQINERGQEFRQIGWRDPSTGRIIEAPTEPNSPELWQPVFVADAP